MEFTELLVVVLMVLVNAVFAGYEIALASVSVSRLQFSRIAEAQRCRSCLEMKEAIEKSLAVVQLGITMVGSLQEHGGASATDDIAPYFRSMGLGNHTSKIMAITLWSFHLPQ